MKKYQTSGDYKSPQGEINTLPSLTVPDMSMSILELLQNHTRGITPDIKHYDPQYFEEQEIPKIDDLTDLDNLRRELEFQQQIIENELQEQQNSETTQDSVQSLEKEQNSSTELEEKSNNP